MPTPKSCVASARTLTCVLVVSQSCSLRGNAHLVGERHPSVAEVLWELLNQIDVVCPSRRTRHGEDDCGQDLLLVVPRARVQGHARAEESETPVRHDLCHAPTCRSNQELQNGGGQRDGRLAGREEGIDGCGTTHEDETEEVSSERLAGSVGIVAWRGDGTDFGVWRVVVNDGGLAVLA